MQYKKNISPLRTLLIAWLGILLWDSALSQTERFSRSFDVPDTSFGLGESVLVKDSGGYVIAGASRTNGYWGRKVVLYDLSPSGDTLRTSVIGGGEWENYWEAKPDCFIRAKDSGYYVAGNYTDTSGTLLPLLYRIGPDLDTMWTRTYKLGDTLGERFDAIEVLPSGDLLLSGLKQHPSYGNRAWFLKVDPQGQVIWERGVGAYHDGDFQASSLQRTPWDGGFLAAGLIDGWLGPGGNDEPSALIIKLDSTGALEWKRSFMGEHGYAGRSATATRDSGCIVAGVKWITDGDELAFARKYSSDGDSLWHREYPPDTSGAFWSSHQYLWSLSELEDGSLVGCGWRELMPVLPEQFDSTEDGWVFKTNARGELIWERHYRHAPEGDFRFRDVEETENGLITVGYSNSHNVESGNAWILKLDSMGCLQEGCAVNVPEFEATEAGELQIYPNPASEHFHVRLPKEHGEGELRLYDLNGRLLSRRKIEANAQGELSLQADTRRSGTYLLRWSGKDGKSAEKKLIVR